MMNQKLSQKINLMSRLLQLLKDGSLHESTRLIVINLIRVILVTYKNANDILKLIFMKLKNKLKKKINLSI